MENRIESAAARGGGEEMFDLSELQDLLEEQEQSTEQLEKLDTDSEENE